MAPATTRYLPQPGSQSHPLRSQAGYGTPGYQPGYPQMLTTLRSSSSKPPTGFRRLRRGAAPTQQRERARGEGVLEQARGAGSDPELLDRPDPQTLGEVGGKDRAEQPDRGPGRALAPLVGEQDGLDEGAGDDPPRHTRQ